MTIEWRGNSGGMQGLQGRGNVWIFGVEMG